MNVGEGPNEPPSKAALEQLVQDEPTELAGDCVGVGPLDPLRPPSWLPLPADAMLRPPMLPVSQQPMLPVVPPQDVLCAHA